MKSKNTKNSEWPSPPELLLFARCCGVHEASCQGSLPGTLGDEPGGDQGPGVGRRKEAGLQPGHCWHCCFSSAVMAAPTFPFPKMLSEYRVLYSPHLWSKTGETETYSKGYWAHSLKEKANLHPGTPILIPSHSLTVMPALLLCAKHLGCLHSFPMCEWGWTNKQLPPSRGQYWEDVAAVPYPLWPWGWCEGLSGPASAEGVRWQSHSLSLFSGRGVKGGAAEQVKRQGDLWGWLGAAGLVRSSRGRLLRGWAVGEPPEAAQGSLGQE